jgi:hypothetical protein
MELHLAGRANHLVEFCAPNFGRRDRVPTLRAPCVKLQLIEIMVELVGIELLVGSENTQATDSPSIVQCPEHLKNLHSRVYCTVIVR